jgi:CRP/FNR family cyclic AMP-dependent transcriptional regulator
MAKSAKTGSFDPNLFLATVGGGRIASNVRKEAAVFAQGDPADSVFYIRRGKIKIAVTSDQGKEAVIAILEDGAFFGEGCLSGQPLRLATATAMSETSVVRITKTEMVRVLHAEPTFAEMFTAHLLIRNSRVEKTWSISCSIPARSAWRGRSFCWRISARKGSRSRLN